MNRHPDLHNAKATFTHVAQASGTACVVTLSALTREYRVVDWISYSYSASPTNGKLTVTIAGVTKYEIDITAAGPDHVDLSHAPIYGEKNEAVVVTLADGTVNQKLTVRSR